MTEAVPTHICDPGTFVVAYYVRAYHLNRVLVRTVYADVPEFRLQAGGIAAYYGDLVLVYDTETSKYSRAGAI